MGGPIAKQVARTAAKTGRYVPKARTQVSNARLRQDRPITL
jgi:hypothetical protein